MSNINKIGYSIRRLRKSKKTTLKELSEKAGLSIGYLSNLERNVTSPTLQNIQIVCEALDTSITDLLEKNAENRIVVRKSDRDFTIDEKNNIRLESVDFGTDKTSFDLLTVYPESNMKGMWWTHECEEYGIVISGELVVVIEEETYKLHEGDMIFIKAHTKHCCYTDGKDPCVSFWAKVAVE